MEFSDRLAVFYRDYPYREISVAGTPWRYRTGGAPDGPALLLLAGGTLVPDPFALLIGALGQRYRIIAPAYPPITTMAGLVAGVGAILDAEGIRSAHVFGSSFGGYLAQCFVRAQPDRVDSLILAQTGVRHFVGAGPVTMLRWFLQIAPAVIVRWVMWRTWRVLLADIGPDRGFWTGLLRGILDTELSKAHLVAATAAIADFTGHHRPVPGDLPGWNRPILVLQSEHDRAFAPQASQMRAVYPDARFHVLRGAGHGALFTHTTAYLREVQAFLAAQPAPCGQRPASGHAGPRPAEGPVR